MSSMQLPRIVQTIGAAATLFASPVFASALAQGGPQSSVIDLTRVRSTLDTIDVEKPEYTFESRADSLSWARSRAVAEKAKGFHIVVSLQDRHLWAVIGEDTVLSAPVAVAKGTTLTFGKRAWTFKTPRGIRTVLRKEADPVWQPPEWLYAETAKEYDLKLGHLSTKSRVKLAGGGILTVRDGQAGVIQNGVFDTLPTDEHIVFGDTLYVPPLGSKNRKVEGELGKFRLDMGEGFLLHGTPYKESIGMAATHGCVRMRDEDIEWLYDHIPVGTKVYIY